MFSFPTFIQRWGVYHWEDYRFSDGTQRNKYWIALNCKLIIPDENAEREIPALLPTSQVSKYQQNQKLKIDTVLIKSGESKFFIKDTIIDLKNIQWDIEGIIAYAIKTGNLKYIGLLEDNIQNRIENAIENAYTLSQGEINILLCKN